MAHLDRWYDPARHPILSLLLQMQPLVRRGAEPLQLLCYVGPAQIKLTLSAAIRVAEEKDVWSAEPGMCRVPPRPL